MFQKLLIFALLCGIAFCQLSYKQELLQNLNEDEAQLKGAKVYAENLGFNLYQAGYDKLLVEVEKLCVHANALKNDTDVYDDLKYYQLSVDLRHQVELAVKTPFPREHLKANALYLSAMKELSYLLPASRALFDEVVAVIKQEGVVSKLPENAVKPQHAQSVKLDQMYESLESKLQKIYVPSFQNHYLLKNNTREYLLNANDGYPMTSIIRQEYKSFWILTYTLAEMFPISSEDIAARYKVTSLLQYAQRKALQDHMVENAKVEVISLKEKFLSKLFAFQGQVSAAVEKFRSQGFVYYALELKKTLRQVQDAIEDALKLAEDANAKDSEVEDLEHRIKAFDAEVPVVIVNPAPKAAVVAKALYLAASKIYPKPQALVAVVQDFVDFARYYASTSSGPSAYLTGRYRTQADTDKYIKKFETIVNMIQGVESPTQSDFEKLLKSLRERVQKFDSVGMVNAVMFEKNINDFENQTREMNNLLPISDKNEIESYFKIAASHYENYKRLEKQLA